MPAGCGIRLSCAIPWSCRKDTPVSTKSETNFRLHLLDWLRGDQLQEIQHLQDEHLEAAAPVLGIAASVGGYTIMELNQDLLTVTVTEGLTEDAITARLHEGS